MKTTPTMRDVLMQAVILDEEEGTRRTVSATMQSVHYDAMRMLRRNMGDEGGETMLWFAPASDNEAPSSEPLTILGPDERILVLFRSTPDNPLNDEVIHALLTMSARLEAIVTDTRELMGAQIGQEIGFERSTAIIAIDGDRERFLQAYGFPLDEELRVLPGSPAEARMRLRGTLQDMARRIVEASDNPSPTLLRRLYDGIVWLLSLLRGKKS